MLDCLPDDVLLQILDRLPEKSLIRLTCVSKFWMSHITKPAFISDSNKLIVRYLDVQPQVERYKLIYEDNDNNDSSSSEQIQDLELPKRSGWDYFQLVGSANGLFCLRQGYSFIFWNPCIRKFITLPNPCPWPRSPRYLGFGFDSKKNDYKVVRISERAERAEPSLVEVYSVRERSWRVARGGDSYPARITFSLLLPQPASLNGAFHFAADDRGDARRVILSFVLGAEVFRVISLPNGKFGLDADIGISVFNGLLSLLSYGYQQMSRFRCCSVWVMKEYGVVDSWTKQFTIEQDVLDWKVLGFLKNGHVLVQKIVPRGSELLSYDPESEQVKNLGSVRSSRHAYADNYVRNLPFLTNHMM